jgi:hypothetical protein
VILSVAADNFNGLPNQETLDAVGDVTLLRTDVNGWIELSSDGQSVAVEVEISSPPVDATATPDENIPTAITEPPASEPPATEAPVTEAPVTEAPVTEPPATEPPIATGTP